MSTGTGTAYAIGSRKSGILFVTTEPLQVSIVSPEEIQSYADAKGLTFDAAFGDYAVAASKIVLDDETGLPAGAAAGAAPEAVGARIAAGATMSDADFCFIAPAAASAGVTHRRNFFAPPQAANEAAPVAARGLRAAVEEDEEG